MDGPRFDGWVRQVAGEFRRRDAIKAAIGVALAGLATRAASSRVLADNGNEVGDFCDDEHPCNEDKGLVCVSHECEKKESAKCEGKGCKKNKGKRNGRGKRKGKGGGKHHGGPIHDPAL